MRSNVRIIKTSGIPEIERTQDSYQLYFERNAAGIYVASLHEGILENCNEAFAHLLGYVSPLQLFGTKLSELFVDGAEYENFVRRFSDKNQLTGHQVCFRRKDESSVWLLQDISRINEENSGIVNILGTVVDITSQKEKEEQFLHSAFYDSLTGLPNRCLFLDRLSGCFDRARRNPDYQFAVLFLDLDRFKWVNDSFGHRIGDELLLAAAKRLNSKMRSGDTVARLGGDEFAILLGDVHDALDATRMATRIQTAFENPFRLGDREIFITVSTGIALSSGQWLANREGDPKISPVSKTSTISPPDRPEDLLWEADAVLYRAKQMGRARYEVFDEAMHKKIMSMAQLERELRHAVVEDQFVNYYQPVISIRTGRIIGFEACLRWQHPQRGILEPDDFMVLAEQIGLRGIIDRLIIKRTCRQIQELQKKFPNHPRLFVSTNISIPVFHDLDFVRFLTEILEKFGIEQDRLRLEISESSLIEHFEGIGGAMNELRSRGISIILDEFGTGFSSLKGLPQFPVDILKVDSSLIAGMKVDEMYVGVVGTLIALGNSLGFSVFAEGLETERQISELKRLGCEAAQGIYFSPPVAVQMAHDLIAQDRI
jgi:diguanylate cyclase (GGDEF)-like protein/PAS domain S-box-containing protein